MTRPEPEPRTEVPAIGRRAIAPVAVAAAFLLAWAALAVLRAPYPYELEWMEGGMLQHVERVRGGEALYVPPTLDFGPFPYTPLYPWAAAGAAALLGGGFLPLRLVSIASTLLILGLLGLAARSARGPAGRGPLLAGLLSAGLFAAGNAFTGGWLDIARVDALATALGLAAFVTARAGRGAASVGAAAALAAAACLAKQTQLAFALATAAALLPRGARVAGAYLAALGALLVAAALVLDRAADGWFRFWTFELLRDAPVHGPAVLGYWRECGVHLGPAALVVAYAALTGRWRGDPGLWTAAAALLATGWIGRAHEGGFENNLIPAMLAAALLFGPAAAHAVAGGPRGALLATLAFATLAHDPRPMVPTAADRRAGDALVERLRTLEPPLWISDHGYLAKRAFGPEASAGIHGMVVNDLLKSGHDGLARAFVAELEEALAAGAYGAVVLDERIEADLPVLRERYRPPVALWEAGDRRFTPVTGAPKRPAWLYLRSD